MPLELNNDRAVLSGLGDVDMVEDLMAWLQGREGAVVDVTGCPSAHMAILQVLLVGRPHVVMSAASDDPSDWRTILVRAGLGLKQGETV